MARSWKTTHGDESASYWPAVADMATATCVILIVFWIAGTWELYKEQARSEALVEEKSDLEGLVEQLRKELKLLNELLASATSDPERMSALQARVEELNSQIGALQKMVEEREKRVAKLEEMLRSSGNADLIKEENAKLEKELAALLESLKLARERLAKLEELHKEPPNIVLSEGEDYTFPSGKAFVTAEFAKRFREVELSKIVEALNSPSNVEIVEIVGHTDRKPIPKGRSSNLDGKLSAVFEGTGSLDTLSFGSNTDLGMARAVAVKALIIECLKEIEESDKNSLTKDGRLRLKNLVFRTYSAAHLFPASEIASDDQAGDREGMDKLESDRRIEIRFTRFK